MEDYQERGHHQCGLHGAVYCLQCKYLRLSSRSTFLRLNKLLISFFAHNAVGPSDHYERHIRGRGGLETDTRMVISLANGRPLGPLALCAKNRIIIILYVFLCGVSKVMSQKNPHDEEEIDNRMISVCNVLSKPRKITLFFPFSPAVCLKNSSLKDWVSKMFMT